MKKMIATFVKRDGWKRLMAGAAMAGLAIAGACYQSVRAKTDALEFSCALMDRVSEMEELNHAIGQMAAGETNDARRILEARLCSVSAHVRDDLERADVSTRAFAVLECFRSAQAEQARPAFCLSPSGSTGSEARRAAGAIGLPTVRHVVKETENN